MWHSCRSEVPRRRERGFTVPEALVTLIILVVVLLASAQLLFRTRESAERQRAQVEARQTARSAVEYVHYLLRGATDMNARSEKYPDPGLLLVWLEPQPGGGGAVQFTYDNVTDPNLADPGTDVLTFARAEQLVTVSTGCWEGGPNSVNVNLCIGFTQGCPDSAANLALFKQLTGYDPATGKSDVLVLFGSNGNWAFLQITDYKDGDNDNNCSACGHSCGPGAQPPGIWVIANPGLSDKWNIPQCCPNLDNPQVALGVRYVTLRVKGRALQQKNGLLDPNDPDNGFFTVMPNVEDFQVAYFFRNGEVRNDRLPQDCSWATNCVPVQDQVQPVPTPPATVGPWHAANVVALRVTITARSASQLPPVQEPTARFRQPVAENHDPQAAPDRFYHYQSTAMVLLRNRAPKS